MPSKIDQDKVDQAALALLSLGRHESDRTWKTFHWEIMGRLHQKGYITALVGKAKSVIFTAEGLRESERLFNALLSQARRLSSGGVHRLFWRRQLMDVSTVRQTAHELQALRKMLCRIMLCVASSSRLLFRPAIALCAAA